MTPLRVLVIGGTGFLGQHIVKAAVAVGAEVASVSRRGQPTFAGSRVPLWATKVSWHSADILSPTSYASHLANTDAVVYTVGTLFDDTSYKKNVREGNVVGLAAQVAGRALTGAVECVVGGADRVGQSVGGTAGATVRQAASVASMAAQTVGSMAGGTVGRSEQSGGGGYESLNRDGALLLARTIPTYPSIRTFVYISSADLPLPAQLVVDRRYIETKREAEAVVMEGDREGQWRGVVVRPGLIYSDDRPITLPIAATLTLPHLLPTTLTSLLPRSIIPSPPVHVTAVADAVVDAVVNDGVRGIVAGRMGRA